MDCWIKIRNKRLKCLVGVADYGCGPELFSFENTLSYLHGDHHNAAEVGLQSDWCTRSLLHACWAYGKVKHSDNVNQHSTSFPLIVRYEKSSNALTRLSYTIIFSPGALMSGTRKRCELLQKQGYCLTRVVCLEPEPGNKSECWKVKSLVLYF